MSKLETCYYENIERKYFRPLTENGRVQKVTRISKQTSI